MKTNIIKPKYEEEERKNEKCRIEKQSEEELGCFKRSHRRTKKISLNAQPGLMERRSFLKNFIGEKLKKKSSRFTTRKKSSSAC
jgi:hypothetical protein